MTSRISETLEQAVRQEVERGWFDQVAHLQALVREPSVLGHEAGAQRVMRRAFGDLGLEVHAFEPDIGTLCGLRGFSPPEWGYQGRPNVVGIWRAAASGGRSLVLNGHVDVVSAEPLSGWHRDPWGAEIVGERLYGRGACDMKSGLCAMTAAVRALRAAGVRLRGDVILQSVIEEECTGNGTLACLDRGFTGDGCVIVEPHYGQALVAQVGVLWCRVTVRGVAGHVKATQAGVNAIEKVYVFIRALRDLEHRMNAHKPPVFADVAWPINFNPGVIRGGDWPSSVPAECTLEFRMGFYPEMSVEEAKALVRRTLGDAVREDPWFRDHPPDIAFYGFHAEGMSMDFTASPVIQTLSAAHQHVTGRRLTPSVLTATTDARFFHLYYGVPVTCYGARGAGSHGADEYVELPTVREATHVLAAFIPEWCGIV